MGSKLRNVFNEGWGFQAEVSPMWRDDVRAFRIQGGQIPRESLDKAYQDGDYRTRLCSGGRTDATGHAQRFAL